MRFALLIAAGAVVGAVAAFTVPDDVLLSASSSIATVSDAAGQLPHALDDLNPIRLAYDEVQKQIREGRTPEQLGFKPSAVTVTPFVMPNSSFDFNRNSRRVDMRAFAQTPAPR